MKTRTIKIIISGLSVMFSIVFFVCLTLAIVESKGKTIKPPIVLNQTSHYVIDVGERVDLTEYYKQAKAFGTKTQVKGFKDGLVLEKNSFYATQSGYFTEVSISLLMWSTQSTISQSQILNASIYSRETDFSTYKSVTCFEDFATYGNQSNLIIMKDFEIDCRNVQSHYVLFNGREFTGQLVNPYGYIIKLKNSEDIRAVMSGNSGIVDGLIVENVEFGKGLSAGSDKIYGLAQKSTGVLANCKVSGDLFGSQVCGLSDSVNNSMIYRCRFTGNITSRSHEKWWLNSCESAEYANYLPIE